MFRMWGHQIVIHLLLTSISKLPEFDFCQKRWGLLIVEQLEMMARRLNGESYEQAEHWLYTTNRGEMMGVRLWCVVLTVTSISYSKCVSLLELICYLGTDLIRSKKKWKCTLYSPRMMHPIAARIYRFRCSRTSRVQDRNATSSDVWMRRSPCQIFPDGNFGRSRAAFRGDREAQDAQMLALPELAHEAISASSQFLLRVIRRIFN